MPGQNKIWTFPDERAFKADKSVHIWLIRYDKCLKSTDPFQSALTEDELQRAKKFHFEIDYQRFVITRGLLKRVLAKMLGKTPLQIVLELNEFGKPSLKNDELFFNVSHSGNLGLIAVTDITSIGVDVEKYRKEMSTEDIARRFFSEKEVKDYLSLKKSDRLQGFFNCWTRKEAFIKAVGKGLSLPLRNFDVTLKPGQEAVITAIREPFDNPHNWELADLPVDKDYAAAFTIRAAKFETFFWQACTSPLF